MNHEIELRSEVKLTRSQQIGGGLFGGKTVNPNRNRIEIENCESMFDSYDELLGRKEEGSTI